MKTIFLFIAFCIVVISGLAQESRSELSRYQNKRNTDKGLSNTKLDRNRIYYGGYLDMNFNKNYSVIGVQPLVGYKLTPELSVGTQLSYEYISDSRYIEDQNGSNYGASIFSRYRITPNFYTHTEFSLMSYKWFYSDGRDERKLAPMLYVGGGYSQPVSDNMWLNAQVLFDVLNHKNSPNKKWEPFYSIGFGVGF